MKKRSSYRNLDYAISVLREYFGSMIEKGIFPSQRMLRKVGIAGMLRYWSIKALSAELDCVPTHYWLSTDKHIVESFVELVVDEYLYSRRISHKPAEKVFGKYFCDQKINESIYVEVWGYGPKSAGKIRDNYLMKRRVKEELYESHGYKLISIEGYKFYEVSFDEFVLYLDELFSDAGLDTGTVSAFDYDSLTQISKFRLTKKEVANRIQYYTQSLGRMPTLQYLRNNGDSMLAKAINKHGGIHEFYRILNKEHIERPKKYWKNEDNVLRSIEQLIDEHGTLPGYHTLPIDIKTAISRNGGIAKYQKIFGYATKHFWTHDEVLNDVKAIVDKIGRWPTKKILRDMSRNDLECAMSRHGGVNHFKTLLGFVIPNQWDDEKIITELIEMANKLGRFPTQEETKTISGLTKAIQRHGGLTKFRTLLNFPPSKHDTSYTKKAK